MCQHFLFLTVHTMTYTSGLNAVLRLQLQRNWLPLFSFTPHNILKACQILTRFTSWRGVGKGWEWKIAKLQFHCSLCSCTHFKNQTTRILLFLWAEQMLVNFWLLQPGFWKTSTFFLFWEAKLNHLLSKSPDSVSPIHFHQASQCSSPRTLIQLDMM